MAGLGPCNGFGRGCMGSHTLCPTPKVRRVVGLGPCELLPSASQE